VILHKHILSILVCCLFSGCSDLALNDSDPLRNDEPYFQLAGRAVWQLQHEDGSPIARVMLDMYAYYEGVVENVWFHGKIMDNQSLNIISQDSVFIGFFEIAADSNFSIYRQDGYQDRPDNPKWSMWVTH